MFMYKKRFMAKKRPSCSNCMHPKRSHKAAGCSLFYKVQGRIKLCDCKAYVPPEPVVESKG